MFLGPAHSNFVGVMSLWSQISEITTWAWCNQNRNFTHSTHDPTMSSICSMCGVCVCVYRFVCLMYKCVFWYMKSALTHTFSCLLPRPLEFPGLLCDFRSVERSWAGPRVAEWVTTSLYVTTHCPHQSLCMPLYYNTLIVKLEMAASLIQHVKMTFKYKLLFILYFSWS